eukprot:531533_1
MIKFDIILKDSISLLIGRTIPDSKWSVIINSIKRGGLGLRTSIPLLSAYFLPSIHHSIEIAKNLIEPVVFTLFEPELNRRIQYAISDYNSRVHIKYQFIHFDAKIH